MNIALSKQSRLESEVLHGNVLNVGETIILLSLRREFWQSSKIIVSTVLYRTSLATIFLCLSTSFVFAPVSRYEIHVACYDRKVNVPRICLLFLFIFARVLGSLRVSKRIPSLRRGICKWTTQFLGWRPFAIFCQSIDIIEFYSSALRKYRAYVHICLVNWTNLVLEISLVVFGTASENS